MRLIAKTPIEIPEDESEYLAKRGRKSKNGASFQWGKDSSQREKVRHIQEALTATGYSLPKYGVDGLFGPETTRTVKKFQKEHKDPFASFSSALMDDGIVGPKTAVALNGVLASEGYWLKEYKYEWTDAKGDHIVHFTRGDKASKITPKENQDIKIKLGGPKVPKYRTGFIKNIWALTTSSTAEACVTLKDEDSKEVYGIQLRGYNDKYGRANKEIFDVLLLAFKMKKPVMLRVKSRGKENPKNYYIEGCLLGEKPDEIMKDVKEMDEEIEKSDKEFDKALEE